MTIEYLSRGGTVCYCSSNEITVTNLHGERASQAGVFRPAYNSQRQDCIDGTAAHDTGNGNSQNDTGKCKHEVRYTHENHIHLAAEVTGNNTDCRAYRCHQENDNHSHGQGNPGAVEDTGEAVTTELIGTKDMITARLHESFFHICGIRVKGSDYRSENRSGDNQYYKTRKDPECCFVIHFHLASPLSNTRIKIMIRAIN